LREKECLKSGVENTEISITNPASEPDCGEAVDDDDASD